MKTSELTGDALVCAVAMCEGYTDLHKIPDRWPHEPQWAMMPPNREYGVMELWEIGSAYDWGFCGPIIERERIQITPDVGCWNAHYHDNLFEEDGSDCFQIGKTPLIAAMRCYVASKLGDEIELPEELMTATFWNDTHRCEKREEVEIPDELK